jgi:protein-disulfide isomerase
MATPAAVASECAGLAGKFWQFHDQLFGNPAFVSSAQWDSAAARAGVTDMGRFADCVRSHGAVDQFVQADIADASRLGLTGTPALLLNSTLVIGLPPTPRLGALIEQAIRQGASR